MLNQISQHVYVSPFDKDRDRPNIGYVKGENFSVLIDTGNSPEHLQNVLADIEKMGLEEPKLAIISHWHWDHTFGMTAFKGLTMAHEKTNASLIKMSSWQWNQDAMEERLKSGKECQFCHDYIQVEYDDVSEIQVVPADIVYKGEMTLDLGNVHLSITPIDNPHSDDGVVILVEEDKVLFAGDADSGNFYELDGGYRAEEFYQYIETVDKFPFDTYIHGHLEPMDRQELNALRQAIIAEEL